MSLLNACGSSTDTIEIREYNIAVLNDDPTIKFEFQKLIAAFNSQADMDVLNYVDNPDQANSVITLTKGLKSSSPGNNKIGYGQWLAEIEEDQWFSNPTKKRQRVVRYAMRVELDEDYIVSRIENETAIRKREKQILFFHEVGHGLEMSHSDENLPTCQNNDVMCKNVVHDRDMAPFFNRVRSYMTQ
jgi:hypothetical protein